MEIQYQYGSLEDCVAKMKKANANIESEVNNLKTQVQGLLGSFTGTAASRYDACAAKIQTELNKTNTQLLTLSTSVARSAADMKSEDTRQGNNFAG